MTVVSLSSRHQPPAIPAQDLQYGYVTAIKHLQMEAEHDLALGNIVIHSDAVMLKEAQVTAQALKVTLKEDTFVYNSAAYRTPEGSTIEELVKRLPGAQVDDDGKTPSWQRGEEDHARR